MSWGRGTGYDAGMRVDNMSVDKRRRRVEKDKGTGGYCGGGVCGWKLTGDGFGEISIGSGKGGMTSGMPWSALVGCLWSGVYTTVYRVSSGAVAGTS